jgi:hypothetical protein
MCSAGTSSERNASSGVRSVNKACAQRRTFLIDAASAGLRGCGVRFQAPAPAQ